MKSILTYCLSAILFLCLNGCKKNYESVSNDPMNARIYTLDNGLKVYMSVNPEEPRIQAHIAVRAGSKNDPHETTGLAHYLEHIMFKGTTNFGTLNYEAEKPLLDEIEQLYETYRCTTDKDERTAIYHQIDSVSYEASKFFIANEYDKLMAAIGAVGTNAYTSDDVTCYTEDIPSNEVERWAMVQSDRFKNMVIRGFHTELETVYEEFNISLTQDSRKCVEGIFKALYHNHPYGTQSTIGTQEHLKNPSIKNIKEFFNTWYVPNNVAICLSGDFDPEETLAIINKYFGDWTPSKEIPAFSYQPEEPISEPIVVNIVGQEQPCVYVAWRFPGAKDVASSNMLSVISNLLDNGKSGIFDTNIKLQQRLLQASAFVYDQADYTTFFVIGRPNEGQSLEEVKDILLENVQKVAAGEFDESLLEAIINNSKLEQMQGMEQNRTRVSTMVDAFINHVDWKDVVSQIDELSKITKLQIVDFAKCNFHNGYAVAYKQQGEDNSVAKIEKPAISPIEMNRDKTSEFVQNISNMSVKDIEPKFIDFNKELTTADIRNGNDFLYVQNKNNGIFDITYQFTRGQKADKMLHLLDSYFDYLSTDELSAEEIQAELYRLACNVSFSISDRYSYISVSGLAENQQKALELVEKIIKQGKIDEESFDAIRGQILRDRVNIKGNQRACYNALLKYVNNPDNSYTHVYNNKEIMDITPEALCNALHSLPQAKQIIRVYTPTPAEEIQALIEKTHTITDNPEPEPENNNFSPYASDKPELFIAPYKAANIYLSQLSVDGRTLDLNQVPVSSLFNEYFGNGMNGVVFQELREARGLAYSAYADYSSNEMRLNSPYSFLTYIISQNDKLYECMTTFNDIVENTPFNENALEIAKSAVCKRLASKRTLGRNIFNAYLKAQKLGLDHDINEDTYKAVKTMTLDDLKAFHSANIKGRTYRTLILGDESQLDAKIINSLGTIHRLSLEDIFGF